MPSPFAWCPWHAISALPGRRRHLSAIALCIAAVSAQAAMVRAATLPEIQAPAVPGAKKTVLLAQRPEIRLPQTPAQEGPQTDGTMTPQGPQVPANAQPSGPTMPSARSSLASAAPLDPALQKELAQLQRQASPKSGYGSTSVSANAAWLLGLIALHENTAPRSTAQALVWFERAARHGRQALAWSGVAWCEMQGCAGPPGPSLARQAIDRLRPAYRPRALYLQWLLDTRQHASSSAAVSGPEGVSNLRLPLHDLLAQAAGEGDAQARVELGIEAVVNGDLQGARAYFQAAATHSPAAADNLQLLDGQVAKPAQQQTTASSEAEKLLERARMAHRGTGRPPDYAQALRLYEAAAAQGSASARRMLALIFSRPQPDGTINLAWMAQLAWLDTSNTLPQLQAHTLSRMMRRDPTPLFDLLPPAWQRALASSAP